MWSCLLASPASLNWSPVFSGLEGGVGSEVWESSRYSPGSVSLYSPSRLVISCGQPGLGMQLPRAFLDQNTTALAAKSSTFTKEWIKLSFGVFEEEGFEGDGLYPSSFVEGNSNKSNNGCPSKQQVCNIVSALI